MSDEDYAEYVEPTPRQERDHLLVVRSTVNAGLAFHDGYDGWLFEELKELCHQFDATIPLYGDEPKAKRALELRLERLRMIEGVEAPEALKNLRDHIDDVENRVYESVIEARQHVNDAILRLDDLVRQILDARRLFDDLEYAVASGPDDED